ncbi:hypothetical protein HDU98_011502 [Podochytrium sp. JEL0797]|nr:hypothetical protein HDU98_011502 [Podochytrium sp. JEL0797]
MLEGKKPKSELPSLPAKDVFIDETFNALAADAKKYGSIDVMLSINCATMETSALWLKKELEARGVSVWMCTTELQAGENYRDGIFQAVKNSRVMIPFINSKWAKSGECESEFSLAVRTNLISHDSGKTARIIHVANPDTKEKYPIPGIRRPSFLPLKFSDVEWTENPAIEQLSCSTNFVVCDYANLTDPAAQSMLLPKILNGLYNLGMQIASLPNDPPIIPMSKRSVTKNSNPVELAQQVISGIQFQLQNAQDLFTLVSKSTSAAANSTESMFIVFDRESLHRRYLGYCANERDGCEAIWSLEFLIETVESVAEGSEWPLVVPVKGSVEVHLMSITDVDQTQESKVAHGSFLQHVNADHSAVAKLTGKFDRRRGMVVLDAFEKEDQFNLIRLCKYRLVLETGGGGGNGKSQAGKQALGLFNPIDKIGGKEEWTAVIRLVATY